jgi:hypothetical protein
MTRRYIAIALSACLLVLLLAASVSAWYPLDVAYLSPTIYVSPSSQQVPVGDTFTAEIRVAEAADLGGFEFTLSFDPAVVSVEDVRVGGFISSTNRSVAEYGPLVDNTAGTASQIAFSFSKPALAGASGSGLLATVTLHALAEGTSTLTLTRAQLATTLAQSQAGLIRTDGSVTVVSAAAGRTISLSTGWNLISYDLWPMEAGQPVSEVPLVLQTIGANYSLVQGFDPVLGGLTYDPELPFFSTLTEMDPYHGYWIKATAPCVLTLSGTEIPDNTPLSLATGWNLISYLPDASQGVEAALASIAGQYSLVQGFDPVLGGLTYDPELPFFSTLTQLDPGRGYWIKMTESGTLVYSGEGAPPAQGTDVRGDARAAAAPDASALLGPAVIPCICRPSG